MSGILLTYATLVWISAVFRTGQLLTYISHLQLQRNSCSFGEMFHHHLRIWTLTLFTGQYSLHVRTASATHWTQSHNIFHIFCIVSVYTINMLQSSTFRIVTQHPVHVVFTISSTSCMTVSLALFANQQFLHPTFF